MGTCVVGGMLTSTVLTLVVIPVVYSLIDDISTWFMRLFRGSGNDQEPAIIKHPAGLVHTAEDSGAQGYGNGNGKQRLLGTCVGNSRTTRNQQSRT